jgi:hypothetical protein
MNGSQKAVLWIGLILVAVNLVMKWSEISAVIFKGSAGFTPATLNPAVVPSVVGGGFPTPAKVSAGATPPQQKAGSGPVPVA